MSLASLGAVRWFLASAGVVGAVATLIGCKKGEGAIEGKTPPPPSIGPVKPESKYEASKSNGANGVDLNCSRPTLYKSILVKEPKAHLSKLTEFKIAF